MKRYAWWDLYPCPRDELVHCLAIYLNKLLCWFGMLFFDEIKIILKITNPSSWHNVYYRKKPKNTRVVRSTTVQISQFLHIRMSFDTNYESYNEKLRNELWTTKKTITSLFPWVAMDISLSQNIRSFLSWFGMLLIYTCLKWAMKKVYQELFSSPTCPKLCPSYF